MDILAWILIGTLILAGILAVVSVVAVLYWGNKIMKHFDSTDHFFDKYN